MAQASENIASVTPLRRGEKAFLRVMGNPFLVEVLGVNAKELWVSFPGEGYPLDGMGAQLEFHTETGYTVYHTQVVRGPRREGDGVVLERTETSEDRKHRRHWRVPSDFTVVIQPDGDSKRYTALLDNLSAGGMLVRSYAVMAMPCTLQVAMPLGNGATHHLRGRIVYGRELSPLNPGPTYEYGVNFTEIPLEAQRALTWYLYKAIRKLYPHDIKALYPGAGRRKKREERS